jgi:6-phosphogluconolactonase
MPEIISALNQSDVYNRSAVIIKDSLNALLKRKKLVVFGVSGGTSPLGVYDELVAMKGIDWKRIHVFLIDERMVDIKDNQSNTQLIYHTLINPLIESGKLPKANFHPVEGSREHPDQVAAAYQKELINVGGKIDVLLLGVGEDGHIASLFPNNDALDSEASYFISVQDAPKLPASRLTATKKLLQKADCAVVLFCGQTKQEAYDQYRDRSILEKDCPIKILDKIPNLYLCTAFN